MIRDVLQALKIGNSKTIDEFVISDISNKYLHPCELQLLVDVIKFVKQYETIKNFIQRCSSSTSKQLKSTFNKSKIIGDDINGLYLQSFCDGIDVTIQPYRDTIVDLELRYLRKPDFSLMFVFSQIDKHQYLFSFLLHLINSVTTQKLHGCNILQFLHTKTLNGNKEITDAVIIIQKYVYSAFLKQLTQWLLYGSLFDTFGEFFIQKIEQTSTTTNNNMSLKGDGTQTTVSDTTSSVNHEMWRYVVCYDILPYYFPASWAEKVLFIGQTILMFNPSSQDSNKRTADLWYSEDKVYMKISLYNHQEDKYIRKLNDLMNDDSIKTSNIEMIVDEIKSCVTKQLSEIAINEADLLQQLRLIKDYYLLGRGELFLEFIKNTQIISKKTIGTGTMREINKALRLASNSVNISDNVAEQFSFYVPPEEVDSFVYETKGFINFLTLRYKVKWPLHLLFSPKVLDRYNDVFRFLLKIKQLQHNLQLVWCHHREHKMAKNSKILQLRNKLMHLIDNLQYYLQVDVLESQFSILMSSIEKSKDFEHIQKAHTMFQANILGLCFLLNTTDTSSSSTSPKTTTTTTTTDIIHLPENPILTILNKIMSLIDSFYIFSLNNSIEPMSDTTKEQFDNFDQLFAKLMNSMFIGLKASSSNTPLSQLLLRLNYNYFYSTTNTATTPSLNETQDLN